MKVNNIRDSTNQNIEPYNILTMITLERNNT